MTVKPHGQKKTKAWDEILTKFNSENPSGINATRVLERGG